MKLVIATFVMCASSMLFAGTPPVDTQKMLEEFYQNHEVARSVFYCRTDIKAPECRTLMIYKSKQTGKTVKSFQMAFSAPFRQAAGTELFIQNSDQTFTRIVDTSVDGKNNGTLEEARQEVQMNHNQLVLKNIKFGATIGDLEFNGKMSKLTGSNNGNPVNLVYPILMPRK